MATSNNRDVKMTLSVETLGDDGIQQLRSSLLALAKGGGDAAPEFKRLADEIDRLGEQAGALKTFEALNAEVQALGAQQVEAASKVRTLKTELASVAAVTDTSRQAQAAATAELKRSQDVLAATNGELKILRNSYDDSGKRVANYKADLQRLVEQQVAQSAALKANREAQKAANAELTAAEDAQKKVESSLTKQEKALKSLNTALDAQQATLKEQAAAVEGYGLSTDDLALSQAKLLQAINGTGAAAGKLAADLDAVREAERQLDAQNELANQRMQERMTFMQQSAAREEALSKQRIAAAELQAEAERKAAAETKSIEEANAAAEKANFAQRIADLNTEIKYRRQLAAERKKIADETAEAEKAAELKAAAERKAIADKAAADQKAAAKAAADAIESAFTTAGAKSTVALRQQIQDVRTAMQTLGSQAGLTGRELAVAMSAGNNQIKELERQLREATGQMTLADRAANLFKNSLGQIAAGNLIADGIGSLINQVKDMGRQFITANLEMERLTRTMTQITGTAQGASDKIKTLRDTANLAGVAVGDITDSFIRFNASAQTAGIASSQVDSIFQAVTVSGSKMGLTSDRVALALDALGQIASKGTVSMEELRQQLGDSLPGALAVSAKGLGVTTEQLVKMVETGQLAASEFFPAFRRGLEESFGSSQQKVEGLAQAFNRLRNAFRELYQEAADSAAFKALATSIDFLAANFRTTVDVVYGLGKALVALKVLEYAKNFLDLGNAAKTSATGIAAKTAAVVADTTATAANTAATAANTAAKSASATATAAVATATVGATAAKTASATAAGVLSAAWVGLSGAARGVLSIIGGFPGLFVAVALNARELGTAIGEQAAKWMGWGKVMDEAQAKLRAADAAEKAAAAAREARTAQLEQALKREILALAEKVKATDNEVMVAEKATKAIKEQGDFEMRLADLYGDTALAAQASVTASQNNLTAAEKELAKKRELVFVLQDELAKRNDLIASGKAVTQKFKEETAELANLIAKKKEEAASSATSVEAARLEAAQRRISVETLKDNSGRLVEFAGAVAKAKERVEELTRAQQIGLPVDDLLKKAKIELAEKTRLHTDAMTDNIRNVELSAKAKKVETDTIISGLEARKTELESLAKSAEAQGRDSEAVQLKVQAKQVEIQIIRETVKAIEQEVAANIKKLQLQRDSIQGTDDEANARRRDLDIQIKQESARGEEARSRLSNIRNINDEINALLKSGNARDDETSAIERNNEARERAISAREKENELREREIALENKRRNVDKEGFTLNTAGNRIEQSVDTQESLYNEARSNGLSPQAAKRLADQYAGKVAALGKNDFYKELNQTKQREEVTGKPDQTGLIGRAPQAVGGPVNTSTAAQTQSASFRAESPAVAAERSRISETSGAALALEQQRAAERGDQAKANRLAVKQRELTKAATQAAGKPTAAKTYNVQIGGKTIRTASDADAQALIGVLKSASLTA